ncbi:hypothetical protein [Scytonema sp. NUACC21]
MLTLDRTGQLVIEKWWCRWCVFSLRRRHADMILQGAVSSLSEEQDIKDVEQQHNIANQALGYSSSQSNES